ncbi:MAG: efflux RND transporter periplasmic adaptor subunit, partial [Chloroflexi bacterium]|nr:efflux RND transporter periplasmic adaptor subunit [Chloroflexota bacterium]
LTLTEHSVSVGEAMRAAAYARDETYRFYQNLVDRLGEDDRNTELAHNAYLDALGAYNRAVESSEMQMTTAQNDVTRAYHALQQAQDSLDRLLEGTDEADVEAVQLDVDAAELGLEKARSDLDNAVLQAPFDGIVAAVNATVGEMASTGLPAITLLDTSGFRLTISVDEMDVGRLAVGQIVQVTLDALPDAEISGAVERIAPAATLEGGIVYYEVVVGLEPADVAIRADMTANATIVVEELPDVLTIPTWIVRVDSSTGQTYVNRQVGENVERVDVELGVRYEGIAQVLNGLSEGDVIVWVESTIFELQHP